MNTRRGQCCPTSGRLQPAQCPSIGGVSVWKCNCLLLPELLPSCFRNPRYLLLYCFEEGTKVVRELLLLENLRHIPALLLCGSRWLGFSFFRCFWVPSSFPPPFWSRVCHPATTSASHKMNQHLSFTSHSKPSSHLNHHCLTFEPTTSIHNPKI